MSTVSQRKIPSLECWWDKTRAIKQGMMQQILTGRVRLVNGSRLKVDREGKKVR